jgi:Protein of unknown function (DUF2726)
MDHMEQLHLETPLSIMIALFFVTIMIGVYLERWQEKLSRVTLKPKYPRKVWRSAYPPRSAPNTTPFSDSAAQMNAVLTATFSKQPLLNKSETRVFSEVEKLLAELKSSWRLMAQVSLGEILKSPNTDAFWAVNSKRVDMLLIDRNNMPLHVLEYQGKGHHQGNAAARDAIKKEALRRANIGYHEIVAGDRPADLRALIIKLTRDEERLTLNRP